MVCMLLSCNSAKKDIDAAEFNVSNYYSYVINNRMDSVSRVFSAAFYGTLDSVGLIDFVHSNEKDFGKIKSYELAKRTISYEYKNKIKNKVLILTYKVQYIPEYTAKEKFRFFLNDNFNGKIDGLSTTDWNNTEGD